MRILSCDVGIKNFACCVLEKENDIFKILHWELIDCSEKFTTCNYKTCSHNAKYIVTSFDGYVINVCKTHKKKVINPIINVQKKYKIKCLHCSELAKKYIPNTNYAWCALHINKHKIILKQIKCKVNKESDNYEKQKLFSLSTNLYKILDNKKYLYDVDEIIIEKQPHFVSDTMKAIASHIFSYFTIRGYIDNPNGRLSIIKDVSSSNKLKVNDSLSEKIMNDKKNNNGTTKKDEYNLRKELSVQYCKALIDVKNKNLLETHKKQDDLCDAFLQGFKYLFNPVPKHYFEKISSIGVTKASFLTTSDEINKVNLLIQKYC
jgi:hypothetical protein